MHKAPPPYT